MSTRTLTYDEKKAAEAAFRGLPRNPDWPSAAMDVYDGLVKALLHTPTSPLYDLTIEADLEYLEAGGSTVGPSTGLVPAETVSEVVPSPLALGGSEQEFATRDQAVRAGLLVDISAQARDLGIRLPVAVTKPLWDYGVTGSETIPDREHEGRIRDLLVALRLHLSQCTALGPVTQFPALLSFPPDPIPQVYGICAVVHTEGPNHHFLTLVLPSEVPDQSSESDS